MVITTVNYEVVDIAVKRGEAGIGWRGRQNIKM